MLGNLIEAFIPRQRAATVQTLGHPAAGVIGWWDASQNASGEAVTAESALTISAFWCGVRVISELVASLPCIMYERVGESDKRRATNDPRYWLMHDSPNDELDAYHFIEASTAHQVVWGNSYGRIVRDGFNEPTSIDIRLPDRTRPTRRSDGVLIYECTDPRETVEGPEMLHGVGFSYDGVMGYSVVHKMAQTLGIAMAADKYSGAMLKNGGVPSGVLDLPVRTEKSAREQLRREWDEIHGGASKSARLAITHGGMKYTPISMNNKDAELLDSRKFSTVEIARVLRLPPYVLNDLENSSVRANIEQQAIDLIAYSLMPWVKRWEGMLKMKLLRRQERQRYLFEFLLDSLLRSDTLTRYQAYAIARQWGWESVNEIREKENRNGIGEDGDVYLQPLNMAPAGEPTVRAELPQTIVDEYRKSVAETINQTVETAKEMRSAIAAGFSRVDEAFDEFGIQLQNQTSTERETFRLIKEDIAELGQKVAVRVPEVPKGPTAETLADLESKEVVKAARAQMRDKSANFIKRMEAWYATHDVPNADQHMRELLECCDGDREGFEQRVKDCVERWKEE